MELGEVLAGETELLDRYDDAEHTDPLLHTINALAADWARIGRTDPIPEPAHLASSCFAVHDGQADPDTARDFAQG
ncbi:hypothetical protein [Nocardia sp. NPDC003183]